MDNKEMNEQSVNQEEKIPVVNPTIKASEVPNLPSQENQQEQSSIPIPSQEKSVQTPMLEPLPNTSTPVLPKELKKNMFNSKEQVIYNVKKEQEGNPLAVFLILLLLCAFVFFLPKINELTSKTKKEGSTTSVVTPSIPQEEEKKLGFHEKGYIGDLEITNLVTTYFNGNYELNFTIINNGTTAYTFNKKYYVVLYDEDRVIYRALIHSYTPLASKSSIELSLIINEEAYKLAKTFQLQEIQTSMYPDVTLTKEEEEFKVLTCSYQTNTITYYFKDNTLYKINDDIGMSNLESINYEEEKENYRQLSDSYKNIIGMQSTFIENPLDFRLINEFYLGDIQDNVLSNLKVYKYFRFREHAKVVAFEMETIGYTCS